jgi:hypothetical protein
VGFALFGTYLSSHRTVMMNTTDRLGVFGFGLCLWIMRWSIVGWDGMGCRVLGRGRVSSAAYMFWLVSALVSPFAVAVCIPFLVWVEGCLRLCLCRLLAKRVMIFMNGWPGG